MTAIFAVVSQGEVRPLGVYEH